MIYFMKDCPFSAHIITERNVQTPICVALFPEYFHSRLAMSNYIRQRYVQKMKEEMNGTYDPEVMGRMEKVTDYQPFSQEKYVRMLKQFLGNYE